MTTIHFGIFLPLLLALEANAGITLSQFMQALEGKKPSTTNSIRIEESKIRIDLGEHPGEYLVYRGDKKALWTVDSNHKTFSVMTEKDLRLLDRNKDQRAVYRNASGHEMVGAWPAEKYEGVMGGAKESDIWTSSPKTLGFQEGEVKSLRTLARFISGMGRERIILMGSGGDGLNGFAVRTVAFKNGAPVWVSELREIKKGKLPLSLFDIPAGFTRIQSP